MNKNTQKWQRFIEQNRGKKITLKKLRANLRFREEFMSESYLRVIIHRLRKKYKIIIQNYGRSKH